MFVNGNIHLYYLLPYDPDYVNPVNAHTGHLDEDWWNTWVTDMATSNPDTIFFLVVESTNVFKE